jgi:hypothetical protein
MGHAGRHRQRRQRHGGGENRGVQGRRHRHRRHAERNGGHAVEDDVNPEPRGLAAVDQLAFAANLILLNKRTPATLSARCAAPRRRGFGAGICWRPSAAAVLRALFYWQIGSAAGWTGKLDLGVTPFFPQQFFGQMLLFSIFSFARTLGIFYLWLLLLSILDGPNANPPAGENAAWAIDGWPRWIKLILPLRSRVVLGAGKLAVRVAASKTGDSAAHRIEESLVIGLGSYLVWKFLRRAARAASAEQLHLFRQTSVLELRERDGANNLLRRWKKFRCARARWISRRSWELR